MRHSSAAYRRDPMGKAHRRQKLRGFFGYHFGYSLALQEYSHGSRRKSSSPPAGPCSQCPVFCGRWVGGEKGTGAVLRGSRAAALRLSHKALLTVLTSSRDVNRLFRACPCATAQPIAPSCSLRRLQCIVFCKTGLEAL